MKIKSTVIEKYMELCPKSSAKCNSFSEIEDKIIRAIHMGKRTILDAKSYRVNYYHNCFIVKSMKVVDMYKDVENQYHVAEHLKREYDAEVLKVVI
ncbi:hypothetical protein ACH6EH_07370 [Paenibacillus sp. JSM ZJ436]|uniref:hypothetical protein n=1 Tax=Paenibacillus sp. JSM ZJ436 TaxID=3376190 RepID=UPI0037BB97CB